MFKQRNRKAPLVAVLGSLAFISMPAAAQAHELDRSAEATCTVVNGVPTVNLTVKYEGFQLSDGEVSGMITLDSTTENVGPYAWVGTSTYTWTKATSPGIHTVSGLFTWANQGTRDGKVDPVTVTCPAPPTETTTPAAAPASGAVLPETIASGLARLSGKSGCVKQAFRAQVSGRSIASVSFYMRGKLLKNISAQRAVYSAKIRPGRLGFGRHKIIARVTFVTGSATSGRTLAMTFRRCAKAAAAPTFTG